MSFISFVKPEAQGFLNKLVAYFRTVVNVNLKFAYAGVELWVLVAAGAAFAAWSSLIGLFGAIVG